MDINILVRDKKRKYKLFFEAINKNKSSFIFSTAELSDDANKKNKDENHIVDRLSAPFVPELRVDYYDTYTTYSWDKQEVIESVIENARIHYEYNQPIIERDFENRRRWSEHEMLIKQKKALLKFEEIFFNNTEKYLPGFEYLYEVGISRKSGYCKNVLIMTNGYGIFAVIFFDITLNTAKTKENKERFIKENLKNLDVISVVGVAVAYKEKEEISFVSKIDSSITKFVAAKRVIGASVKIDKDNNDNGNKKNDGFLLNDSLKKKKTIEKEKEENLKSLKIQQFKVILENLYARELRIEQILNQDINNKNNDSNDYNNENNNYNDDVIIENESIEKINKFDDAATEFLNNEDKLGNEKEKENNQSREIKQLKKVIRHLTDREREQNLMSQTLDQEKKYQQEMHDFKIRVNQLANEISRLNDLITQDKQQHAQELQLIHEMEARNIEIGMHDFKIRVNQLTNEISRLNNIITQDKQRQHAQELQLIHEMEARKIEIENLKKENLALQEENRKLLSQLDSDGAKKDLSGETELKMKLKWMQERQKQERQEFQERIEMLIKQRLELEYEVKQQSNAFLCD
ncbi:11430_t:CDS:2 [Ambispora leptoticha]|uniref:11430_t:CDS:1 n=1 Tax=Ambispora leptoticha TaxID=144679 RepID=A0A9N9DEB9_9GLOM|nr:11430_t:CDS:2 [Ambispora leptoticha]